MEPTTLETDGGVAVVRLDDGKVNALGTAMLDSLDAALDRAANDPDLGAVVLTGRPGVLSAGFDLKEMQQGPDAAVAVATKGAELIMRLYGFPKPVVVASTGHALAAGALLLLAGDLRLAPDEPDVRVGLNEMAIGIALPIFAMELARARLSRRHFTRATALATIYSPAEAVDVGYLDEVVQGDPLPAAVVRARGLVDYLDAPSFARSRIIDRQATIDHVHATLEEDLARFGVD